MSTGHEQPTSAASLRRIGPSGPFVVTAVELMNELRGASNARVKRELGWQPRYASWQEGFRTGLG